MDRREFLASVRAEGYKMTDRMLTDWIQRGLVAQPAISSDGHGVDSEYPPDQLQLTLQLLDKHQPGHGLDGLYNLPVGVWLYWHNAGIVPLSQTKRALGEWVERRTRGGRSGTEAAAAAKALADQFIEAGVPKAEASTLNKAFQAANSTGTLDLDHVQETLGEWLDSPHIAAMVRILERLTAGITNFDSFTDDDFRQARVEHLGVITPAYRAAHIEELTIDACKNLTGHLGELHLRQ